MDEKKLKKRSRRCPKEKKKKKRLERKGLKKITGNWQRAQSQSFEVTRKREERLKKNKR